MKRYWTLSIVFLLCTLCKAIDIYVKELLYVGPYAINTPIMIDSVAANGQLFSTQVLLKKSNVSLSALKQGKIITASELPTTENTALHLVGFTIEASQYTKANLNIQGLIHKEVYINGLATEVGQMNLEPGTHDVVIKYLSQSNSKNSISIHINSEKPNLSVQANLKQKRTYNIKDVLNGTKYYDVSLSAGGRYLLTRYATTLDGGQNQHKTVVSETATGKTLLTTQESIVWMPQSERYYYTRKGLKGTELVTVSPTDGQETILTNQLPEGQFTIAPTEDYLIITEYLDGPREDADCQQIIEPDDRQPGWRKRPIYSTYNLSKKTLVPLVYGHQKCWISDISRDGKNILMMIKEQRITKRPFYLYTLLRIQTDTHHVDTILQREGFVSKAQFCTNTNQLLITGTPESFDGIALKTKDKKPANMYEGEYFLYDIPSKRITPLTENFNPSVNSDAQLSSDGLFYFTAGNRDRIDLYSLNTINGIITPMNNREEVVRGFSKAYTANNLVYYGESVSNGNRLYSINTKKQRTTLIEDIGVQKLENITLGECKEWNFMSSRGDSIYGRYYLPPHFDPTKKYPLIVNYYGGCTPTPRYFESRYPHHLYAAMGYIVYVVQPSGATGFGQEFAARHVNAWGDYTADDILEGTEKFCQEHNYVNKEKIGCIGASYGGFMTQTLQIKSNLFAAAISHAGISNITSYWGEGYWGYSYSEIAAANSYPWNNPDLYTKHSPLFNADKIHTPILFLHGNVDTNVPIGESIQMYTALKMLGRETEFITITGQDHQILNYGKRIKWQNTIFAWFAKWLQDDSTWWEALYPKKNL